MLKKLLIANRGEIAARIARTARRMGLGNCAAQRLQIAEFVIAHAQAVARLTGIDGVGTEGKRSAHHGERSCRSEKFGSLTHSKILKNHKFYLLRAP